MRIFTREMYNRLEENEDELYNTHYIRKGNGRGRRRIDEPAPSLMEAQKFALRCMNSRARMITHWRACGCIPRLDVRNRVMEHVGYMYAITTDIKDFYPSVTYDMLTNVNELQVIMDNEDIRCCMRTIGEQMVLPQGAPTSPMLANVALLDFDRIIDARINGWVREKNGNDGRHVFRRTDWRNHGNNVEYVALYSRYMDDILVTLNCRNRAEALELKDIILAEIERHGFIPNRRKTKLKPYFQRQAWIGFNLCDKDTQLYQPFVDKRYVNKVIAEAEEMVIDGRNPIEDISWRGKLEYIRYNNERRYWRVVRKTAIAMFVFGMEIPQWMRGTGAIAALIRRINNEPDPPAITINGQDYWAINHFTTDNTITIDNDAAGYIFNLGDHATDGTP